MKKWQKKVKKGRKAARAWLKQQRIGPFTGFYYTHNGIRHLVELSVHLPKGYEACCHALGVLVWGATPAETWHNFHHAVLAGAGPAADKNGWVDVDSWEVRVEDGFRRRGRELDEVIVGRWFHLERMSDTHWWMRIGDDHVNVDVEDGRIEVHYDKGVSGITMVSLTEPAEADYEEEY